ncbi:MAG: endolytic transglycosylase MltG [Muribaculaceae bacterium]|nr:endolytic transglycosylase MltG [Muribaculaceae bacterium]
MTQKQSQKKKDGASAKMEPGAILSKKLWITILVALFILGGIILLYIFLPVYANKTETSAIIKIPANATSQMVEDSIAKYFGPKYASKVTMMTKLKGTDFGSRHGAFLVDSGVNPLNTARILSHGQQHPVKVVVNGARGIKPLAEKISRNVEFASDSLVALLNDPEFLKRYDVTPEEVIGLFPDDTYLVYWSAKPEEVVAKIAANYNKIWNEQRREKARSLGLTPLEVTTLASIVDEETNKSDEKPMVARLYLNRLKKGMKLQADPTVKFATGDFSLRRIRNEHLATRSPYNTYLVEGLPPGPIRTVTTADIDAVLNAPQHPYLYMCAKEDFSGYHNFASDYSTHLSNARRYQKELNRRGIM